MDPQADSAATLSPGPRRLWKAARSRFNAILYAGSNLSLHAVTTLCYFVVLRWIEPEYVGIWQAALVLHTYLRALNLGIVHAMNREYPYFIGRDEPGRARLTVATAQSWVLVNAAILVAVFVALSFAHAGRGRDWRLAYLTMAAFSAGQTYRMYVDCTYRAGSEFRTLALIRLGQIPVIVATVALPAWMGFDGFLVRMLVIETVWVACSHVWRPVRVAPGFRWETFKLLLSTGWRLHLAQYLILASRGFPRLAVLTLGGTYALGLFAPVAWMLQAFFDIANSLGAYMYPALTRRYARHGTPVGKAALRVALWSMLALAPVVLPAMFVLQWIVPWLLPNYAPALPAMQVALVASLLDCITISRVAFASMKAWGAYFVYIGFLIVLNAGGAFGGGALLDDQVLGVAIGKLLASAAMVPVTWVTVSHAHSRDETIVRDRGDA